MNKETEQLFSDTLKTFISKYKGYIILTVIFIMILTVVYFTAKGKVQYVNVQDTAITRRIDSIRYANTVIQERINTLEQNKEQIKYLIVNNKKEYENKIDSISNNNADSNYNYILRRLQSESGE